MMLVKVGHSNWKKGPEKFREHVGIVGSAYNDCSTLFFAFKDQRQSVTRCVSTGTQSLGAQYRTRLTAALDVVRFLLVQRLAFRGHRESKSSMNRGNYKELFDWYSERNDEVGSVVNENAPSNHQMTSHRTQTDLITSCGSMTRKSIIGDIRDKFFSLLVNEARDNSIKEQMTIVIRYVNNHGAMVERFLGVVHVVDTKALSLKSGIDEFFAEHGLSISQLRGQGYDGASNMRGKLSGLKTLILNENLSARYIHYFAHQLQLVVVTVSKDNRFVSDFFGQLSLITNMVGASCKRKDEFRQLQHDQMVQKLEKGEISTGRGLHQESSLSRLGATCWGSRYTTIVRIISLWSSTVRVLENVFDDGSDIDNRGVAYSLVGKMETYHFVFIAHLMRILLGITNALSQFLQKKDLNIIEVVDLVQSCKSRIQRLRENGWDELLENVNKFCEENKVAILKMEDNAQGRLHSRSGVITNHHHFRVEIFSQVIDKISQEMENRFSESNTELLTCIGCLDPNNLFSNFSLSKVLRLVELYPQDFTFIERQELKDQLETWIEHMRGKERFSKLPGIGDIAKEMVTVGNHTSFHLVYRLLELVLVLPVATASVERAFSAMNIIKTDLRNKMLDDHLSDNLVCYIEKEIFKSIDNEGILQYFQNMRTRKMDLPSL